eukprot:jgi/Psemu1/43789/gm1.43789_g
MNSASALKHHRKQKTPSSAIRSYHHKKFCQKALWWCQEIPKNILLSSMLPQGGKQEEVCCIQCGVKRDGKTFKYVSIGLTRHVNAKSECYAYYETKKLNVMEASVVEDIIIQPTKNGPQGHSAIGAEFYYATLNNQVVPNVLLPPIAREAIESCTITENEDDTADSIGGGAEYLDLEIDYVETEIEPNKKSDDDVTTVLNDREKRFREQHVMPVHPQDIVKLELMNIISNHKLPLSMFNTIFKWAKTSQYRPGFDFATTGIQTRDAISKGIQTKLRMTEPKFYPKIVNWLLDNKPAQIYVRPFTEALYSLLLNAEIMVEENLSFPSIFTPLSLDNNPPMTENTFISELCHGKWWSESWKLICQEGNPEPEILVPLIFYMDGISLDAHGRLTLTPLNMTLGIFNVEIRKLPQAWTTIYFHPDNEWESTHHSRKPTATESVQNLHNAIEVALASFEEISERDYGILWEYLLYAGKLWKVRMKFAIAYVIGDTELHDKLCGKFGSRNSNVKNYADTATAPLTISTDMKRIHRVTRRPPLKEEAEDSNQGGGSTGFRDPATSKGKEAGRLSRKGRPGWHQLKGINIQSENTDLSLKTRMTRARRLSLKYSVVKQIGRNRLQRASARKEQIAKSICPHENENPKI